MISPANLLDSTAALCNAQEGRDVLFNLHPRQIHRLRYLNCDTSTPYLPFIRTNFGNKIDTLDEMNPTAGQNLGISINCGNVRNSNNNKWNYYNISVDEKRAVLEWLSPLEPHERHQAIGMDRMPGVGDWLLNTNEFTQWNQGGERDAKPMLFCYGDPGVGKTYLRYV